MIGKRIILTLVGRHTPQAILTPQHEIGQLTHAVEYCMKQIPLTQGKFALVDDEDYDFLMQWKWQHQQAKRSECCYAASKKYLGKIDGKYTYKGIYMHRILFEDGKEVDHIDGNGLNNQRDNLRVVTRSQNNMNRKKQSSKTSSIYKGVHWHSRHKRWRSQIKIDGKMQYIGEFISEVAAAMAYNAAAIKYHGEFAKLNVF